MIDPEIAVKQKHNRKKPSLQVSRVYSRAHSFFFFFFVIFGWSHARHTLLSVLYYRDLKEFLPLRHRTAGRTAGNALRISERGLLTIRCIFHFVCRARSRKPKTRVLLFLFFFFFSLRDEAQLTLSISSRFSFNSLWLKARTKSKPILRV